jgi:molybdate transport system substrate-binding protein
MKFLLILIITYSISFTNIRAEDKQQITILAPQNMSFALNEIMQDYSRNHNISLSASFANTQKNIQKIIDGELADIIITDHPEWIKYLKQKGLINITSINNLVEDKLVLVANNNFYKNNKNQINKLKNIDDKIKFYHNLTIFIPDWKEDMTGLYIHEAIKKIPYLYNKENQIIETASLKKELTEINDALAVIKYSNAFDSSKFSIIEEIPKEFHPRFTYQISIIAGSNQKDSNEFYDSLKANKSKSIFKKYGFEVNE